MTTHGGWAWWRKVVARRQGQRGEEGGIEGVEGVSASGYAAGGRGDDRDACRSFPVMQVTTCEVRQCVEVRSPIA